MKKNLICIVCPAGCQLCAEKSENGEITVSGNKCPRGASYGAKELTNPERTVTAVMNSDSQEMPYIPVRTDKALPKNLINSLLTVIYTKELKVPVKRGDLIVSDFAGSGVNLVASRTVLK